MSSTKYTSGTQTPPINDPKHEQQKQQGVKPKDENDAPKVRQADENGKQQLK